MARIVPITIPIHTLVHAKDFGNAAQIVRESCVAKACAQEIKARDDVGERVLQFTISTGEVDRDKDVIDPAGWDLTNYERGGVVLWAHDAWSPPIARPLRVWPELVDGDKAAGKLKALAQFPDEETYEFGALVHRLYKGGFLRSTSVGFRAQEWTYNEERGGVDFIKQELLEFSAVPVPANPGALHEARAKGLDLRPLRDWTEQYLDSAHGAFRAAAETMHKQLDAERTPRSKTAMAKGVISYDAAHEGGTPLAPRDDDWDGPAEVAAADVEDLAVMSAWVDSDDPDVKASYKLPHHRAAGEHETVWRGVTAAMGALLGARGGVDVPEDDRRGIYDHLARHYADFEEEPPEFRELGDDDEGDDDKGDDDTAADTAQLLALLEEIAQSIEAGAELPEEDRAAFERMHDIIGRILSGGGGDEDESDDKDVFDVDADELRATIGDEVKRALYEQVITPLTGRVL